jgi:hypothetical protein
MLAVADDAVELSTSHKAPAAAALVDQSPVAEGSRLIDVEDGRLRPSMYDAESGPARDYEPKHDDNVKLINCECEYMLDSVHICPNYTLLSIAFSSCMIAFFVLLRQAGLNMTSFANAMIPLYIALALIAFIVLVFHRSRYLRADDGLAKENVRLYLLGRFGFFLAAIAVLVTTAVTLGLVASKLDGNMVSANYLTLMIPVLAGLGSVVAISGLCLNAKVVYFSVGVYQTSALYALGLVNVFVLLCIANLVLIGLRADQTITVSWYIVFIPLLVFFGVTLVWSGVTCWKEFKIQDELSVTTATTKRRLVDCCSLFAYVTPELATAFPLFLFSINALIVLLLICVVAESAASTVPLMIFCFVLPISWIFLMTCASCTLFVSHNPYDYNFD